MKKNRRGKNRRGIRGAISGASRGGGRGAGTNRCVVNGCAKMLVVTKDTVVASSAAPIISEMTMIIVVSISHGDRSASRGYVDYINYSYSSAVCSVTIIDAEKRLAVPSDTS